MNIQKGQLPWMPLFFAIAIVVAFNSVPFLLTNNQTGIVIFIPFIVLILLFIAMRARILIAIRDRTRLFRLSLSVLVFCIAGAGVPLILRFQPHRSFFLMNFFLMAIIGVFTLPSAVFNWRGRKSLFIRFVWWGSYLVAVFLFLTVLYLISGENFLSPDYWTVHPWRFALPFDLLFVSVAIITIYRGYRFGAGHPK